MARASKSLTPKTTGTSLANIDAELANDVALLKNQINQPSGNKIKIEREGSFTNPEGLDLGDQIQVVVVDFYNRNFFYSGPYNPNNIVPPDCYSMGKDKNKMAPEADSPDAQNTDCASCPLNAFKSGANGTSKACQNRYWLAVLLVDPDNPDAHNAPDAPIYTLDLSPSNLKSFEGAVQHVARALNGPPVKAILTVTATNVGTYAKVTFSDPMPNPDYALHYGRRAETVDVLTRRPDFTAAAAAPQTRGRAAPPARRATTPRR